jgi:hypothetical protein
VGSGAVLKRGAKWSCKQLLSESSGNIQIDDISTDIDSLNPAAQERLEYPHRNRTRATAIPVATPAATPPMTLNDFSICLALSNERQLRASPTSLKDCTIASVEVKDRSFASFIPFVNASASPLVRSVACRE